MGSKRVGLARTQTLLQNLKREIDLTVQTTLKNAKITVAEEAATNGAGAISTEIAPKTFIQEIGGDIVTTIQMDLTGLKAKGDAANDVIGLASVNGAYLLQYLTATHGILYKVEVAMLELGTSSGTITNRFNLNLNSSATLAFDGAAGTAKVFEGESSQMAKGISQTYNTPAGGTDTHYLYLTEGDTTASNAVYTAGKLAIKLYGRASF